MAKFKSPNGSGSGTAEVSKTSAEGSIPSTPANGKPKPVIPTDPAECADLLYTTRQARLELNKKVQELEELESALKDFFINNLPKSSTGAVGKVALVRTENAAIPRVNDWDKLYSYIKRKGAFWLLQRRLTESAVKDMWEQKKDIPGVEPFNIVKVSCTKL